MYGLLGVWIYHRENIMSEWQPIKGYDKLKRKPENVVFFFKESAGSMGYTLRSMISPDRVRGYRECTHYFQLPPLPEIPDEQ